jgi:hypothetical protein
MLSNMLTKGLTATVVWFKSVPWLDLVGLVGVGLVEVGLVGVGLWCWSCGHWFVGVGSRALICGNGLVGVVRGSRPGVEWESDTSARAMLHGHFSRLQL